MKSKPRILLVEDVESERQSYSRFLAAAGFSVTQASDGREALALLQSDTFDCIVSDISLPEIDGLGLLGKVRDVLTDSSFVLLLDSPNNQAALKARRWGATEALVKPLDAEALQETARFAIETREARRPDVAAFRTPRGDERRVPSVSATEAKTEFGRVLDMAIQGQAVVITKHDAPKAVLVSVEVFNALSQAKRGVLDTLTDEFDKLLARMQTPESRAAMQAAFDATPAQLGQAALAVARAGRTTRS
jgi:antitoxin Phd